LTDLSAIEATKLAATLEIQTFFPFDWKPWRRPRGSTFDLDRTGGNTEFSQKRLSANGRCQGAVTLRTYELD